LAWLALARNDCGDRWYPALLAITVVTCHSCFDMANQSFSAIVHAPNAITALHALLLVVLSCIFALFCDWRRSMNSAGLMRWTLVAVTFTVFQLVNHLVSYTCSLSERIVFMNLCPLVSLGAESFLMPPDKRPRLTVSSTVALALMVVGAVVFASEKRNLTATGLLCASLLVVTAVPYRLSQRFLLSSTCATMPVGLLAAMDGAALFIPSAAVSSISMERGVFELQRWLSVGSVVMLIALSSVTFAASHIIGLLLLKVNTATSYLVFLCIANSFIVVGSLVLFHEALGSVWVAMGMVVSLGSGLWYACEVACAKTVAKPVEASLACSIDKL